MDGAESAIGLMLSVRSPCQELHAMETDSNVVGKTGKLIMKRLPSQKNEKFHSHNKRCGLAG
jgi:hypothetical protein